MEFDDDVLSEMLLPEFVKWLPELEEHLQAFSDNPGFTDHVGSYVSFPSHVRDICSLIFLLDFSHRQDAQ